VLLRREPQHVVGCLDQDTVGSVVDLGSVVPVQTGAGDAEDGDDALGDQAVEHV
jgi:hypothetical protein